MEPRQGLRGRLVVALMAVAALFAGAVCAQEGAKFDPSDIWFRAFNLLQDGIKSEEEGRLLDALSKYNESKPLFDGLAREFPDFHPSLVEYRRTVLVQKLAGIKDRMRNPAGNAPAMAVQSPATPDPGIGVVNVQPASPEFGPVAPLDPSAVQLPEWQDEPPRTGGVATLTPTTVIRPPSDGSTLANGQNLYPAPVAPVSPELASSSAEAENPFTRIQRDFDRMRAEIDRLGQKNQQLETDLAYRKSELFDAQNALAESQKRTADLQRRLQEAESQSAANPDVGNEVQRLKQILNEALAELEKSTQEKQELLAQLNSTQSELERIRTERDEIEKERNSLQAIMEGGGESAAVAQLMADNRELRDKLKQIEESARNLQKDNHDKTVEIALLKEQVDQIRGERQKLIDDNRRYEGHILELRERLKELGREVTDEQLAMVASTSPQAAEEVLLLRNVVLKQLRRQSQVMKTKELLLHELDKIGSQADNLYAMVEDLASGPKDLTEEERDLFKTPEMIELAEATGVEEVEGVILVEHDGAGAGAAVAGGSLVTQELADELMQIQKTARLDFQEGRFEAAEKAYREYLKYRPKSVVCLCNLALVKMATKDHEGAQGFLEKAISIQNDYGVAYYLLGRNFFQQGRFDEALERLAESIHYDPKNARAHNCVGVISSQKGFINRAEVAFEEAVKIDPDFGDAHFNLAVLFATREKPNPNRAAEHYNRAMLLGVPRDSSMERYLDAVNGAATTVSLR